LRRDLVAQISVQPPIGSMVASATAIASAFLAVPITAIMAIVFSEIAGTRPIAILLSRDGRL
jgi:hypothetical protein